MLDPSLSLSPQAPVFTALSDPAKSTNDILLTFSPLTEQPKSVIVWVKMTVNTAWDLNLICEKEEDDYILIDIQNGT